MPSATMKRPSASSSAYASSLCLRFLPTSVRPYASISAIAALTPCPPAARESLRAPCARRRPTGSHRTRFLVSLLRLQQKAGLPEDRAGVLEQAAVVRLDREGGLDRLDRRPHVARPRRREAEVVLRLDVTGIAVHRELEVAGRLRELALLVGGDALRHVVLRHGVAVRSRALPAAAARSKSYALRRLGARQHVDCLGQILKLRLGFGLPRRRRAVGMGFSREMSETAPGSRLRWRLSPRRGARSSQLLATSWRNLQARGGIFQRRLTYGKDPAPGKRRASVPCRARRSASLFQDDFRAASRIALRQVAVPPDVPQVAHVEILDQREA